MFKIALPILGMLNSIAAERFYCDKLGFRVIYAYRPNPARKDPCWLGVLRDGAHIVLSSFEANGPPGRVVQIYVDDVAAVHREYRAAGVPVKDEILDQDWGNLEFSFVDPDGNRIEIAQLSRSGVVRRAAHSYRGREWYGCDLGLRLRRAASVAKLC